MPEPRERPIDAARHWRDNLQAEWDAKPQSNVVPGTVPDPNCYHVYVSLLDGERPGQQLRTFFKHVKKLAKENGPLPASFMTSGWLIELPTGQTLCGLSSARHAPLATQSHSTMAPLAQAGAAVIRQFAASSSRSTAEIVQGSLVFNDGRRVPLDTCRPRRITSDEWQSPPRKPPAKRPPA
jgi:hypothetical protein